MDVTRLYIGLVMLLPVVLSIWLAIHAESWRAAVMALHLRWEREQRQAGPGGVPFNVRQDEQRAFEQLVTSRPTNMLWGVITIALAAVVFCLLLAWQLDDLRWNGLWLVLPLGIGSLLILTTAFSQLSAGGGKLAGISASLYGPAPPRVKVRSIQVQES